MSYPYFPFTYPTNIGYEGWRPYIESQYMLNLIQRIADRDSEESYEIYCHYRPGDISLSSRQAARIIATYEKNGQAYLYCDGDENPDFKKFQQFVISLLLRGFLLWVAFKFMNQLFRYQRNKWATETSDNLPTSDELIYELPECEVNTPSNDQVYNQWAGNYYNILLFFDENRCDRDHDQAFQVAFDKTILEYKLYVKEQLKTMEETLNSYERRLDDRYVHLSRRKKTMLFPIRCYHKDQHKWNSNHHFEFLELQLPSSDKAFEEFKSNVEVVQLDCDEMALDLTIGEVYREALDITMSSYEIEFGKYWNSQRSTFNEYVKRVKGKIAEIQKIDQHTGTKARSKNKA